MRRAGIRTDVAADHGRYIYAYCHVRTHQVVYSLSQTLNNHAALKQLPDLGANNKDARLRKDLWKPLYTLCLPSASPHTLRQGLHAFKKLREYRKLHELNWTPSPLLSKPKTEAEIEHMKDKLSDRGGNKKENVYDLIVREKKRMRVESVMDQKANSVADLASVLIAQEELGAETVEARQRERKVDRQREVEEMLALAAKAQEGELEALETEMTGLQSRMEQMEMDQQDEDGLTKTKLKRELWQLTSRKLRMEFAFNAVRNARDPQRSQAAPEPMMAHHTSRQPSMQTETLEHDALEQIKRERVRQLIRLAKQARKGGLASLDQKIATLQSEIDVDGDAQSWSKREVYGVRVTRRHMELADEALLVHPAERSRDLMAADADAIRLQMADYKIQTTEEELQAVEQAGLEARAEFLRGELELAQAAREELVASGFLPSERAQAARTASDKMSKADQRARKAAGSAAEGAAEVGPEGSVSASGREAAHAPPPSQAAGEAIGGGSPAGEVDYLSALPSFPGRSADNIPKRGYLRQKLLRLANPIFSTAGITVKWHNLLDAEFAAAWPEHVQHERMGWARYTAPKADGEAVEDVSEYKEMQWRGRAANWLPAEGEEEEEGNEAVAERERVVAEAGVRREFVGGITEGILGRVRAREEERRRVGRGMAAAVEGVTGAGFEQRVGA
ncbi:hypothetical protein LTR36_009932 [Oleoguttula mirabilis]|uniref:Large ribosomal subunit protein mL67 n=1 Tax=Oleoguttula mirabilis TaxID=1507867 RepID=A0AAV9J4S6_9PEZI|nr:hypothetical protein LTR36_009932 [Oleoguttula mirabilis]